MSNEIIYDMSKENISENNTEKAENIDNGKINDKDVLASLNEILNM